MPAPTQGTAAVVCPLPSPHGGKKRRRTNPGARFTAFFSRFFLSYQVFSVP